LSLLRKRRNGTYILNKQEFRSRLTSVLGFRPGNLHIYEKAFIHRSATHTLSDGSTINNERLEFLGDAILDAVLSDYLFEKYPSLDEGELTKLRAKIANGEQLNKLSKEIGINQLLISHINKSSHTRHLYGDALEALIGSVFIDKGYSKTRKFIIKKVLDSHFDLNTLIQTETDSKSQVIQWEQKSNKHFDFTYSEDYDPGNKKTFFISTLRIDHEVFGEGAGPSKKVAEQMASKNALQRILRIGFIE